MSEIEFEVRNLTLNSKSNLNWTCEQNKELETDENKPYHLKRIHFFSF